jgi:hypothetical protein
LKDLLSVAKQVTEFATPPLAGAWTGSALMVALGCLVSLMAYAVVHVLGPAAHVLLADWFIRRNDPEEFKTGGVDYKRRSKPP